MFLFFIFASSQAFYFFLRFNRFFSMILQVIRPLDTNERTLEEGSAFLKKIIRYRAIWELRVVCWSFLSPIFKQPVL